MSIAGAMRGVFVEYWGALQVADRQTSGGSRVDGLFEVHSFLKNRIAGVLSLTHGAQTVLPIEFF